MILELGALRLTLMLVVRWRAVSIVCRIMCVMSVDRDSVFQTPATPHVAPSAQSMIASSA